jgi:hypothetical protein
MLRADGSVSKESDAQGSRPISYCREGNDLEEATIQPGGCIVVQGDSDGSVGEPCDEAMILRAVREEGTRLGGGEPGEGAGTEVDVTAGPIRERDPNAQLMLGQGDRASAESITECLTGDDPLAVRGLADDVTPRRSISHGTRLEDGEAPATGMLDPRLRRAYRDRVMFLMFVVWLVVFVGIFRGWRWTPLLALANLAYTLLVLRIHMTDPIPLNF